MTDLHPHLDSADHPLVKGQLVCWDVCEGARAGRATIEDLRLSADSASGVFRRHEGSGELTIRRYRVFRLSDQADLRPPCNSDLQLCNKGQMTAHGAGFEDAFGEMVFIAPVRDDGRPIVDAVAGC